MRQRLRLNVQGNGWESRGSVAVAGKGTKSSREAGDAGREEWGKESLPPALVPNTTHEIAFFLCCSRLGSGLFRYHIQGHTCMMSRAVWGESRGELLPMRLPGAAPSSSSLASLASFSSFPHLTHTRCRPRRRYLSR